MINNKISKSVNNINMLTNTINNIGSKKLPTLSNLNKCVKLIKEGEIKQLRFLDSVKDTITKKDFLDFQNELTILIFILKKKKYKNVEKFP